MEVRGLGYGRVALSLGKEVTVSPMWVAQPVWTVRRSNKYPNPVGNRTKLRWKSRPETSRYNHYASYVTYVVSRRIVSRRIVSSGLIKHPSM